MSLDVEASASVSADDDTPVAQGVERRDFHLYYGMMYGMVEEVLRERQGLFDSCHPVFLERERAARVLGKEHPL